LRPRRSRRRRAAAALGSLVVIGCAALVAPARDTGASPPGESHPFRWDADLLFAELEDEFARAVRGDAGQAIAAVEGLEREGRVHLAGLDGTPTAPAEALARLANVQFKLAVQGAARPELLPRVQAFLVRSRVETMRAAAGWPLDRPTHEALYRVVFGGRIALDEALVQAGVDALPPLLPIEDIPSAAPSVTVEGVRVHSGDILLSRGGAPTSALIARGNDFANTFSHVALAHVDPETGEATVIESLIEAGSVLSSVEAYLESKKHRILVMRLRPDHPAVSEDPLLAHHAAEGILERVRDEHIPYDFAMEWDDTSTAFCSEIVFHPYRELGVDLWSMRSAMSAPGLARWLGAMGVRELTTLVPSDVEYDPQVRAVAEWRDAPALMDFRLDNAIIDALLEEAERGTGLGYPWYALPAARGLKAYSVAHSALGGQPTIPDGMSAATALRVDALVSKIHPVLKADLESRAAAFREERGFEAPYWTLVELARASVAARREELRPALTP
jgi:hypothetical protein